MSLSHCVCVCVGGGGGGAGGGGAIDTCVVGVRSLDIWGNLLPGDIGKGIPFTPGSFNGAIRWDCVSGGRGREMRGHLRRLVFIGMRVGPVLGNAAHTTWALGHSVQNVEGGSFPPQPCTPLKICFKFNFLLF